MRCDAMHSKRAGAMGLATKGGKSGRRTPNFRLAPQFLLVEPRVLRTQRRQMFNERAWLDRYSSAINSRALEHAASEQELAYQSAYGTLSV
jgi:hypothetical protein